MRHTYLPGLVQDLIARSAHPGIKFVEPWRGIADHEHGAGLRIVFGDGSGFGIRSIAAAGPNGSPTGEPAYDPTSPPPGDVSTIGADGTTGAKAFAAYLSDLIKVAGHPDVTDAIPSEYAGQLSVKVPLDNGAELYLMFVEATGPGGRRLPDWKAADWGVMA
ncbi:hypothetical protein [Polymorphospora sp. A560]|uniref:hypothetical protein n=1 Tax=Polymorphospora sp. A560 TaxID=3040203 RepID=UPI003891CC1D